MADDGRDGALPGSDPDRTRPEPTRPRPTEPRPTEPAPAEGGEFGWLYGARGATPPPPDATQRLPTQQRPAVGPTQPPNPPSGPAAPPPRPTASPTPPAPAPTPQPAPASYGGAGGGGRIPGSGIGGWFARFWIKRLRNPFWYLRFVSLVITLWLVYTIAVPFITWSSNDQVAFEPQGERPADQPGTTYLLVGSDSRANLTEEERKKYHTGNPTESLTDTIMILHTGDGPNVLLSIPRDTYVDAKYGINGSPPKINAAFAKGGVPLLTQVVEDMTGIRIDKYVEIGLGGVADVVDAVGGVEVCPRERLDDKLAGLHIGKGCQEVDGTVALAYSRSRHESTFGDLERVRRQREVVAAIGDKVLSPWTVVNPIRWWRLNKAVPRFFTFGEGTSKLDAGRWALAMSKVQLTCTMPVTDLSAHYWDESRAKPLFQAIIADQTDDITKKQCTGNGIVK